MIRFDDRVWICWALLLLVLPIDLVVSASLAAGIHELFHIAAIYLFGGKIHSIRFGISGAVIETSGISGMAEWISALAGPMGSFFLLIFIRIFPVLGLCGLVQGCFNLLPVYPLDGGRAALILLRKCFPDRAETVYRNLQILFFAVFMTVAVYGAVMFSLGWLPVIVCVLGITSAALRKKP